MITFVTTRGHEYTLGSILGVHPGFHCRVIDYDHLFSFGSIVAGTYVFTDIERIPPKKLPTLSALYKVVNVDVTNARALNDPTRVYCRFELLARLYAEGLNAFNVYRADDIVRPTRYPVFIRWENDHGKPLSDLIQDEQELSDTLVMLQQNGYPRRGLIITEYCAREIAPGIFRKYSAFRVGDRVFAYLEVIEDNWNVKYGTKGLATDEMQLAEQEFIIDNPHEKKLRRVFDLANIEYGRADYSLVDGRIQIYEINTNPHIAFHQNFTSEIRKQTCELAKANLFSAFANIELEANDGTRINIPHEWNNAWHRNC